MCPRPKCVCTGMEPKTVSSYLVEEHKVLIMNLCCCLYYLYDYPSIIVSRQYFYDADTFPSSQRHRGPVHKRTNHVPKDVSERDSALSWFESLILPFVNAKLFQIRLLKRILKHGKRAFWIVIRVESLILGHVNARLFRNVIRACAFWKCALKPCMGQLARTAQWEQNITSQCAEPDRDWEGICNACECT